MVCTQGNLLVLTPKDMILCCSKSALVEAPAEAMRSNTRWSGVLASEGIVFFLFLLDFSVFVFLISSSTLAVSWVGQSTKGSHWSGIGGPACHLP